MVNKNRFYQLQIGAFSQDQPLDKTVLLNEQSTLFYTGFSAGKHFEVHERFAIRTTVGIGLLGQKSTVYYTNDTKKTLPLFYGLGSILETSFRYKLDEHFFLEARIHNLYGSVKHRKLSDDIEIFADKKPNDIDSFNLILTLVTTF